MLVELPISSNRISLLVLKGVIGYISILACLLFLAEGETALAGDGDVVNCTAGLNISASEGYASADPFLLADPAGYVHLFWAEQTTGEPYALPQVPDTVVYARWDGESWSDPVDILLSPRNYFNRRISGIRGAIDDQGVVHLVWIGPDNTLFYSSAWADEAGSARAWKEPTLLVDDQTGSQFSFDLAFESPDTLHVVYGRSPGNNPNSVAYVQSTDLGSSWTEPREIYISADRVRGASNLRLLLDQPNRVYATWTEWDLSGNGQAVYFARSIDSGNTWEDPVLLDERKGDEYERDWTSLAVLGPDQLVALWEGGERAYPQMQYTYDGGLTWGEPIDTFYWLVADNGFAQFARDSVGQLHVFLIRRIRQGFECQGIPGPGIPGCSEAESTNGIWHSVWQDQERWREPRLVGDFVSRQNYMSAVFLDGNRFFTAWFSYSEGEIWLMQCDIQGAPAVLPLARSSPPAVSTPVPTPKPTEENQISVTPTPLVIAVDVTPRDPGLDQGSMLYLGILPSVLSVLAVALAKYLRSRH